MDGRRLLLAGLTCTILIAGCGSTLVLEQLDPARNRQRRLELQRASGAAKEPGP